MNTSDDIKRVESRVSKIEDAVNSKEYGLAVIANEMKHIPKWEEIKEEITQRIDLAQAKCTARIKSGPSIPGWKDLHGGVKAAIYIAGLVGSMVAGGSLPI